MDAYAGAGWRIPQLLDRVRDAEDLYFDAVSKVELPTCSHDRVTLLGDAASCVSLLGDGSHPIAAASRRRLFDHNVIGWPDRVRRVCVGLGHVNRHGLRVVAQRPLMVLWAARPLGMAAVFVRPLPRVRAARRRPRNPTTRFTSTRWSVRSHRIGGPAQRAAKPSGPRTVLHEEPGGRLRALKVNPGRPLRPVCIWFNSVLGHQFRWNPTIDSCESLLVVRPGTGIPLRPATEGCPSIGYPVVSTPVRRRR
jgi:hypothetical protein